MNITFGINLTLINNTNSASGQILSNMSQLQTQAHATANSMNSLNNSLSMIALNEAGVALREVGDGLYRMGKGMVGGLAAAGKEVIKTGSLFEKYRVTFGAFYKDQEEAQRKLKWGTELAATTPFGIKDVVDAQIGLKAIGIEADQTFADANGNMRSFLEYVGDLGALRPDQGVKGALMGIRNGFGGNWRSFTQRFDINPEQILGREMGTTQEQIMKDIVELSQKLAAGLMGELEGTWDQMLANLGDQAIQFWLAIADSGAFDAAKKTLGMIYKTMNDITDDEFNTLGQSLSSVFQMIWKPIDLAANAIVKMGLALKDLLSQHPILGKLAAGFLAITGVATIGSGLLLKFAGGMLNTVAALVFLHEALGRIKQSGTGFDKGMGRALRGFKNFSLFFLKGAALVSLGLLAYQTNFMGFADTVDDVSGKVQASWKKVNDVLWNAKGPKLGEIADFTGFERFLAKSQMIFDVLKTIFGNDNGKGVGFSKRQYDLLNELGLWDLAVGLVMLKGRVEEFWAGFQEGIKKGIQFGKNFYNDVLRPIGQWIGDKLPIVKEWFDQFLGWMGFKVGSDADIAGWNTVGQVVGGLLVAAIGIKGALKGIKLLKFVLQTPFKLAYGTVKLLNKALLTTIARMGWMGKLGGGGKGGGTTVVPAGGGGNNKGGSLPPRGSRPQPVGGGVMNMLGWTMIANEVFDAGAETVQNVANEGFKKGVETTLSENAGKMIGQTILGAVGGFLGSLIPGVGTAAGAGLGIWGGGKIGEFGQKETEAFLERQKLEKDAQTLTKNNEALVKHYMKYGKDAGNIPLYGGGAIMTAPGEELSPKMLQELKDANQKHQELVDKFKGPPLTEQQARAIVYGETNKLLSPLNTIANKEFKVTLNGVAAQARNLPGAKSTGPVPSNYQQPAMYADGAAKLTKPHFGVVAEDGPEAIIPLGAKRRARGIDLWMQAGKELGVLPYAEGGIAGAPTRKATAGGKGDVNIGDVNISIPDSITDPRDAADYMLKALKAKLREAQLKGDTNITLEQLIASF